FLLGPAILFLYAIGECLAEAANFELPISNLQSAANGGARFAAACLASLLATLINPYGWRLHEHVIAYLQNDYLMDHISEFRSFSFHSSGALYVELFLLVAILGAIAMLRQRAFGPALLTLGMLHLALYSARHVPAAAVLLLPLSVAALSREAEEWPRLRPLVDYSKRLRAIDRKIWGVVPIVLVPPEHALASVLQLSSDWKRVYDDSVADVFERVG